MKGDHFTNMETLNTNHTGARGPSQNHRKLDKHRGLGIISQLTTHNRDRLGASHNISPPQKEMWCGNNTFYDRKHNS